MVRRLRMKRRDAAFGRCPCWKFNPEARDPDTPASTPDQPTEIAHRRLSTDSPGEVTGRHNSKSLSQSREIYDQVPRSLCSRSAGCGASRPSRDVSASARSKAARQARQQRVVRDWSRWPVGHEMDVPQSRGTSQTRRIVFLRPDTCPNHQSNFFSASQRRRESASKQRQSFYE
jgi:hypothetical protein